MTEANLRRFFESNREAYAGAKWNVSHIYLPIDADDSNSAQIAKQRMASITEQLGAASNYAQLAERFADLAESESDGATAAKGGRLGWVSQAGDLPAALMKVIRATPAQTLTASIQTSRGLHLLLVHEKVAAETPFEDLEDQSALRRDAANTLFDDLVKRQGQAKVTWLIKPLQPPVAQ